MGAHILDLKFKGFKLKDLAGFRQGRERGEDAAQVIVAESLLDAARINNPTAPLEPVIEPPGRTASVSIVKFLKIRQPPVAKLRDQ